MMQSDPERQGRYLQTGVVGDTTVRHIGMGCRIVAGQYWRERQPRLGGTLHDNRSMFWRWIRSYACSIQVYQS